MYTRIFTITALVAALAACSSEPTHNAALDLAQSQLKAAESNSQVTTLAAKELTEAQKAMRNAELAWQNKKEPATVNHLSYLASQRVVIAEDTASSLSSRAITANAKAERDNLLLQVRTDEANQAKARAIQANQRNLIATEALLAAQAKASESNSQHNQRVRELETELKDLNAKQTERGLVISLGDVLFRTGKSDISASATPTMQKLARFLNRYPEQSVSIEGHTDNTGSRAGNYSLSQRRADAVQTALINQGVKRNQIRTQAYGQENPVASNSTVDGRQQNRRVDIVFDRTEGNLSDRN